jgi:hypothetical protein
MRWRAPADGAVRWQPEREAGVSLSAPLGTRALVHAPVDVSAPGEDPDKPPLYP